MNNNQNVYNNPYRMNNNLQANYNPGYNMMNQNAMAMFIQNAYQQQLSQGNNTNNTNNPNPYSNYYNPLIIQNYYAMCNNQNRGIQNMPSLPPQARNCYATPYTMNSNTHNSGYKSDKQSNKVHYNLNNYNHIK